MKLCRIGNIGEEKPAIIDEENSFTTSAVFDLSGGRATY
jgi:hypothetical protein